MKPEDRIAQNITHDNTAAASWGGDGLAVPGSTGGDRSSDSSPIPQGAASFAQGEGSRSLPEAPVGGCEGTAGREAGAGVSLSLDYCEQVHKNKPETCGQGAQHRAGSKRALVMALRDCGRGSEAEFVERCGLDFKVGICTDCGRSPAFPITCDHRLCPDCAARRGAILVEQHRDVLKQLRYPKMLTLSFLSVEHLDKGYIKWARDCFTKLRRRKVMASCWGGIYSFEATHSVKYGWHLHIHALVGSGYIDQGDLSREWEQITGARVVDIRAVRGKEKWKGVREVVKYPAKADTFLGRPDLVDEFLVATKGVNLAYGFGSLYRVKTKRHAGDTMRCPVCWGTDIDFTGGWGFVVDVSLVVRVKGGYLWRPPP